MKSKITDVQHTCGFRTGHALRLTSFVGEEQHRKGHLGAIGVSSLIRYIN